MDINDEYGTTTTWPISSLTPEQRHELIIRADAVRGLMMDRDPGPSQRDVRVGRIGSRELALRFDASAQTAQHVAALLLGLGWADSKWLFGAGIPTELVVRIDPFAAEWLSDDGTARSIDRWVALLESSFAEEVQPSNDEVDADRTEWMVWDRALEIIARRPWLIISWMRFPDEGGGHLAVHDGAFGAALHFDHPEGPTLGGQSVAVTPLDWSDLDTLTDASTDGDDSFVDWVGMWGAPTPEPVQTDRSAVFTALRRSLSGANLEANDGQIWRARPAELASNEGYSAYDLMQAFPTAQPAIELYADMMVGEFEGAEHLGGIAYWHEPLWVVHRANLPVLLFDEAGQVHMPSSEWLERAQGLAALGTPTGDEVGRWSPTSFEVTQLLAAADHWQGSWMAPASSVVGDLLRSGAGYVRAYLGDGAANGP